MAKTVTWLHLSDLHSCEPRTGWDAKRVLDELLPDLETMQQDHGLRPDFIFFTGDSAFGHLPGTAKGLSLKDQFDDAHAFLQGVRKHLHPEVPLKNVFIVPGNHDIDRRPAIPALTSWLDSQNDANVIIQMIQKADPSWAQYMERLQAYRQFLERKRYKHLLVDPERLIYSAIRNVNGLKVGIAGLNSAWSCCRDGERGKLWFGGLWQNAVLRAKVEKADLSIALIHHPGSWFVEYEGSPVWRRIQQDFPFVLHGHEHDAWVQQDSEGHTTIAAAACYQRSDMENGYNFVRLNLDDGAGEVWLRRYDDKGRGWVPCIVARKTNDQGMWPLKNLAIPGQRKRGKNPRVRGGRR